MSATFKLYLLRPTVNKDDMPSIDDDMLIEEPEFNRPSMTETINDIKVVYAQITGVIV